MYKSPGAMLMQFDLDSSIQGIFIPLLNKFKFIITILKPHGGSPGDTSHTGPLTELYSHIF